MKIALVQCPCYSIKMPPLGIAYLCAVLKKESYPVEVFDFNAELYWKYKELWKDENDIYWYPNTFFLKGEELENYVNLFADRIIQADAKVIGFSVAATSRVLSLLVARRIKELDKDRIIVFGGPECYREMPEVFFKTAAVDVIVQGEGEITLIELLSRLRDGRALTDCNGLIFQQDGKIIQTAPRELIKNLDSLPFPDFSLFDQDRYSDRVRLPMLMSRGCVRRCVFCFDVWYYQQKYRIRSPEHIVNELEYLMKDYNIKEIEFSDLLLNGDLENLEKVCDLLIQRNIVNIEWMGSAALRNMEKKLLQKMFQTGCRYLTFGVESGSQRVIDLMGKGTSLDDISLIIQNTAEAKISITTNWLIGFPGEERADLIETMKFIVRHRRYLNMVGVCTLAINPRTTIHQDAERRGIQLDPTFALNWRYKDNDFKERKHRERVFLRFLCEVGLLDAQKHPNAKELLEDSVYAQRLIQKFIAELDNEENKKSVTI